MSLFVEHLLAKHNLNTLVAATLHSIQPKADKSTLDFAAVNMWYERLDKRYNLSFGPVILPLVTTEHLTQLAKLDPPYLKDFKANIDDHQPHNISTVFGKIRAFGYIC